MTVTLENGNMVVVGRTYCRLVFCDSGSRYLVPAPKGYQLIEEDPNGEYISIQSVGEPE